MKKLILIMLVALFPNTSQAQTVCGPYEELTKRLETNYHETSAGFGLLGNGGLVELYVSDKGTWSFLITRPNGITCLMAAGKHWEASTPEYDKPNEVDY